MRELCKNTYCKCRTCSKQFDRTCKDCDNCALYMKEVWNCDKYKRVKLFDRILAQLTGGI